MRSVISDGFNYEPATRATKRFEHPTYRSDVDAAPFEHPLHCLAKDQFGSYSLPFRCIRTEDGWRNAATRARLSVTITGWKPA